MGILPPATFSSPFSDGSGSPLRQWSSIIGIVTAIIGNILISFALNTQRYAHIRIERQYNESRRLSPKDRKQSPNRLRGYGAIQQQEDIAEQRARFNAIAPGPGKSSGDGGGGVGVTENDVDKSPPLKSSVDSGDTLTVSWKDNDESQDGRQSYLTSPYWWVGIILMLIGETGNFLAYGFAPASIVSPLGVVALISNCVIAPFLLKERFRRRDFWGVLVAVGGAVTVVLSAKQNETKMGPKDLWGAIKRWEFLLYVGISTIFIVALMFASPKYGNRTILIDLGLVGLFGGYTALSTKGVASLLSDTLWRTLTFPISYFLLAILVLSALMQIRYINRALQNYDSTQVIPTQFVLFTLSVIIGSAVLYRDFESATADQFGKFIGGCLLTFFGVYLITSGRPPREDPLSDDAASDHAEGIRLIDEEEQYGGERTAVQRGLSISNSVQRDMATHSYKDSRPVTPDQDGPRISRPDSRASSNIPSIAVTPDIPSAASLNALDASPWLSSTEQLRPAPATQSEPQLPKGGQMTRLQTDSRSPYSTPPSLPQSDPSVSNLRSAAVRLTPSGLADLQTPPRQRRTSSPPKAHPSVNHRPPPSPNSPLLTRSARGSISRLLPGPLFPPLSTSLGALMVDSLLRGEGSPRSAKASARQYRSSRKVFTSAVEAGGSGSWSGSGSGNASRQNGASIDEGMSRMATRQTEPDLDVRDFMEPEGSPPPGPKGRLRAMSEGLEGLIGSRWKKWMGEDDDKEGDNGPGDGGGASGAGGGSRGSEAPT